MLYLDVCVFHILLFFFRYGIVIFAGIDGYSRKVNNIPLQSQFFFSKLINYPIERESGVFFFHSFDKKFTFISVELSLFYFNKVYNCQVFLVC